MNIVLDDAAWTDLEEGTEALLQEWYVKTGDVVDAGQVIATVELVKTTYDVVAPAKGCVSAIEVAEQATFAKGTNLANLEV